MVKKISSELYKGEVKIDFYPDSHRYKKTGERTYLISATSATGMIDKSRVLIPWAVNLCGSFFRKYLEEAGIDSFTKEELFPVLEEALTQHTVKKEQAADIGSQVHEWIEQFALSRINGTEAPILSEDMPEGVENAIGGFLDWYNENDVKFLASERLIYSKKYDYCGLTDFIAVINGKKSVGDYKTSKSVYSDHRYQLSAYWNAIEEEDEEEIEQGVILHVNKETGEFKAYEITREEHLKNLPAFLACLTIKRREKELNNQYYGK